MQRLGHPLVGLRATTIDRARAYFEAQDRRRDGLPEIEELLGDLASVVRDEERTRLAIALERGPESLVREIESRYGATVEIVDVRGGWALQINDPRVVREGVRALNAMLFFVEYDGQDSGTQMAAVEAALLECGEQRAIGDGRERVLDGVAEGVAQVQGTGDVRRGDDNRVWSAGRSFRPEVVSFKPEGIPLFFYPFRVIRLFQFCHVRKEKSESIIV